MRAGDFLAAADRLPVRPLDHLVGPGSGLVVIAPHPDDESLGCGGLIAEACAQGRDVRLVVVSDGVGSHPNSKAFPPARLRALREDETLRAVAALGLDPRAVRFLGLPDRHVPVEGPEADRAVALIAAEARSCRAGALFVTWNHDPHCDHGAAYALARRVAAMVPPARLYAFPVWGVTLAPDVEIAAPPPRGVCLDVARHLGRKRAAIAAHASQTTDLIGDDPAGFRLAPAMIARLTGDHEIFLEVAPAEPDTSVRDMAPAGSGGIR